MLYQVRRRKIGKPIKIIEEIPYEEVYHTPMVEPIQPVIEQKEKSDKTPK